MMQKQKGIMVYIDENDYYRFKKCLLEKKEKISEVVRRLIDNYIQEVEKNDCQ